MAPETSDATPCSCAGMQLFSTPLDPSDLKKSAEVALSRNLPVDPNDIANQINGVRDGSLKDAQLAMINNVLTQQKLDALPEFVKSQPQVMELNSRLTTMQTEVSTKTAVVYGLGQQLTAVEENKKMLLSQKERMEEKAKTTVGSLGAITQDQLMQTSEYQALQGELTGIKDQYTSAQNAYIDAQNNVATKKAQLDDLRAQVTDLQARQNELLAEKKRLEDEMLARRAALEGLAQDQLKQLPDYQNMQDQLKKLPGYQNVQSQLAMLDGQYSSLQSQYQNARGYLDNLSKNALDQLPDIFQNLDSLQKQYAPQIAAAGAGALLAQMPPLPATPATPGFPAMPVLPAMPALPQMPEFLKMPTLPEVPKLPVIPPFPSPMDWIKLPPGLTATPELPAMLAFAGLPEGLPEVPATVLDSSPESLVQSAEVEALNEARSAAGSQGVRLEDVEPYVPSDAKERVEAFRGAIIKGVEGYMTPYLERIPSLPARPELPPFPSIADLTSFAGMLIPTKESLLKHGSELLPNEFAFFSAVHTNIEARMAAAQRMGDAAKEQTAAFQSRVIELVNAQKAAMLEKMPLKQYLEKSSGTNPIFNALANQQVPDFMKKFSSLPETPLLCQQNCSNVGIRNLFPDVTNPTQMDVAGMFANAKELVSTNAMNVLSVGESSADFVSGHIANLESRVKEAGGKIATLTTDDITSALNVPGGMIGLEDKLKGVSMLTLSDIKDLSPQASALVSEISQKMSTSVPVLMTTPSIGTLSTDPTVNSAMISQLAPGGSAVDARKPDEIPPSVYSLSTGSDSKITAMFRT